VHKYQSPVKQVNGGAQSMSENENDARFELAELKQELSVLNTHRFLRMYSSWPRLIGINFLKGLAFGLGSVVGATILVSLLVLFLSKIDFIPIIGEWATEIADQMNSGR